MHNAINLTMACFRHSGWCERRMRQVRLGTERGDSAANQRRWSPWRWKGTCVILYMPYCDLSVCYLFFYFTKDETWPVVSCKQALWRLKPTHHPESILSVRSEFIQTKTAGIEGVLYKLVSILVLLVDCHSLSYRIEVFSASHSRGKSEGGKSEILMSTERWQPRSYDLMALYKWVYYYYFLYPR